MSGQVRPSFLIVSIFVVGIAVSGCGDSDNEGGGTAINLVRGEAIIADSVPAIKVSHDRPDGITNTFYSDSERIFLWIYWINVSGSHRVKVNWYSPEEG